MIDNPKAEFKPNISISVENPPDIDALRAVWKSLRTAEKNAPRSERIGIAMRRQELLSQFPAWQIPAIIDELNREDAISSVFTV